MDVPKEKEAWEQEKSEKGGDSVRLIDADALITECELAQKQADRHGREFANAFYSGGGDISTEWWCVEDMIENAPTIEERKTGRWTSEEACEFCGFQPWYENDIHTLSFCPNCGADMRGNG